jgi:hypothetical protein
MTQDPTSPLAEAIPESLDELFSRDPLQLAEPDIDKIVARLRAERANWDKEQAITAGKPPRAKAGAAKATKATPVKLDAKMTLDDLGF